MVKWAKVWSSRSRRLDTSCTERQNSRPRATKGKAQPRGPWPVSAVTTYWSLPCTSYSRRYCPPCPETHPCRVGWENGVSSLRCFGQCPSFFGSSFITTNDTTQSQRPENWTRWELHILLHHSCIHLISGRASLLVPRETWIVQLL